MKKIQLSGCKTLLCVAVLLIAFTASCGDKDDDPEPAGFSLSETKIELQEGGTSKRISIKGGTTPYDISVSSKEIATVSASVRDFAVTAVKKGTATITVKDKTGKSVSLEVTVTGKTAK